MDDNAIKKKVLRSKHRKKDRFHTKNIKTIGITLCMGLIAWGAQYVWNYLNNGPTLITGVHKVYSEETIASGLEELQDADYVERHYWGTYRSGLYLGLKNKSRQSLLLGMMWYNPNRPDALQQLRHTAESHHQLDTYGWLRHDGESFGIQHFEDGPFSLETTWIKVLNEDTGYGGDFTLRVKVEERFPSIFEGKATACLIFYAIDESIQPLNENVMSKLSLNKQSMHEEGVKTVVSGSREDIGKWALSVTGGEAAVDGMTYTGAYTNNIYNLTHMTAEMLFNSLDARGMQQLPKFNNQVMSSTPNMGIFQVTVPMNEYVDVVFNSGLRAKAPSDMKKEAFEGIKKKVRNLSGNAISTLIADKAKNFDKHFEKSFGKASKDKSVAEVAKRSMSNLVGSIGYFVGYPLTTNAQQGHAILAKRYPTRALLTGVPSRSFFPRGFLWDEGFHQLIVCKWDKALCKEMISSWFDLMDKNGWIPREAILGEEALIRVPREFWLQRTLHANPPSMLFPLHKMVTELGPDSKNDLEFLKTIYPRLKIWYKWYYRTQKGSQEHSFRWRGRDSNVKNLLNALTLTSGLDDYPRPSHPTSAERHLDLRCWMAFGARALADIAKVVQASDEDIEEYMKIAAVLESEELLDQLHYDSETGHYYDWGYHTDTAELKTYIQNGQTLERRENGEESPKLQHVKHFGYVSLFPLMMKLLSPSSKNLEKQLLSLRNENFLWTRFGLRSLSKSSLYYSKGNSMHNKPYWRSPIWINMNYLVLSALKFYSEVDGPHKELAKELFMELKENVMKNIMNQYLRTGYLWEHYNDNSGAGMGTHPFTGWTALYTLIAHDIY